MYVLSTGACSLPNSASPMAASDIAAQDAYVAAVGSIFDNGNTILDNLLVALGGNPLNQVSGGNAGIPTGSVPVPGGSPFGPASKRWRFGGGPGGGGVPLGVTQQLAPGRASGLCDKPVIFRAPAVTTPANTARPTAPASGPLRMVACWDKPAGVDVWVPGPGGWTPVGTPATGPKCWTPVGVAGFFDAFTSSNPGAGVLWGSLAAGAFLLYAVAQSKRRKI